MAKKATFWDHNELGVFFLNHEQYDLAIRELTRAVREAVIPMAVLHINLGAAYVAKKTYREAQRCLEKGLAIDPDSQRGHWWLAETLRATGGLAEALAEYERARALDPDSPMGRYAENESALLRTALESNPPSRPSTSLLNSRR